VRTYIFQDGWNVCGKHTLDNKTRRNIKSSPYTAVMSTLSWQTVLGFILVTAGTA